MSTGYTRDRLNEVFDEVKDPNDWKRPVDHRSRVPWTTRSTSTSTSRQSNGSRGPSPASPPVYDGPYKKLIGWNVRAAGYYSFEKGDEEAA